MADAGKSAILPTVSVEGNGLCSLRPILIILSFMLLALLEGMWESAIAPIWPLEAKKLGLNDAQEHIIFSCFQAAVLFSSPVFGFYGQRLGRQRLVYAGISILCTTSFVFGFWDQFGGIFASRFVAGIGSAAMWSSGFSLIALYFPINQSTVMGLVETAMGMGFMFGSPMGVFLYNVAGREIFWIPFAFCGSLFFIALCLLTITLPKSSAVDTVAKQALPELDPLKEPSDVLQSVSNSVRFGRMSLNASPESVSHSVGQASVAQSVAKPPTMMSGALRNSLRQPLDRGVLYQSIRASKLADAGVTLNPALRRSHWATGSALGAGMERLTSDHRKVVKAVAPEEGARGSFGWINPTTLLTLFTVFVIQTSWASFQSNMTDFLSKNTAPQDFALNSNQVALVLTAGATMYGICAPISGKMTAKYGEASVMSFGCVLSGFGLILVGPIPLIDTSFNEYLHPGVLLFSVCILTTGVGMVYVPSLSRLLISIKYLGDEEADRLTGVVSGVFYACATFGGALGPMLSLVLENAFGLPWVLGVAGMIMVGLAPFNIMLNERHTEQHMEAIQKVTDDVRSSLGFRQSNAWQNDLRQTLQPNLKSVAETENGGSNWDSNY